jgi:serine/threonine protein kinase
VAIKLLSQPPKQETLRYIRDEIHNMRALAGHSHIIGFTEVFLAAPGQLAIVMEYADGEAEAIHAWQATSKAP